ncbi:hypothetical protein ONZ45_g14925 [Pleurotus djamor]|nr:hypothetical protein ONZ45_g14925 [Pleurotus djamor]
MDLKKFSTLYTICRVPGYGFGIRLLRCHGSNGPTYKDIPYEHCLNTTGFRTSHFQTFRYDIRRLELLLQMDLPEPTTESLQALLAEPITPAHATHDHDDLLAAHPKERLHRLATVFANYLLNCDANECSSLLERTAQLDTELHIATDMLVHPDLYSSDLIIPGLFSNEDLSLDPPELDFEAGGPPSPTRSVHHPPSPFQSPQKKSPQKRLPSNSVSPLRPPETALNTRGNAVKCCNGPLCRARIQKGNGVRYNPNCSFQYCKPCCKDYSARSGLECGFPKHKPGTVSTATATASNGSTSSGTAQATSSTSINPSTTEVPPKTTLPPISSLHLDARNAAKKDLRETTEQLIAKKTAETIEKSCVSVLIWKDTTSKPCLVSVHAKNFPFFSVADCSDHTLTLLGIKGLDLEIYSPAEKQWLLLDSPTVQTHLQGRNKVLLRSFNVDTGVDMEEHTSSLTEAAQPSRRINFPQTPTRPLVSHTLNTDVTPQASRKRRAATPDEPFTPSARTPSAQLFRPTRKAFESDSVTPRAKRPKTNPPRPQSPDPFPLVSDPSDIPISLDLDSDPEDAGILFMGPEPPRVGVRRDELKASTSMKNVGGSGRAADKQPKASTKTTKESKSTDIETSSRHASWPLKHFDVMAATFKQYESLGQGTHAVKFSRIWPNSTTTKATWSKNYGAWIHAPASIMNEFVAMDKAEWKVFRKKVLDFYGGKMPGLTAAKEVIELE